MAFLDIPGAGKVQFSESDGAERQGEALLHQPVDRADQLQAAAADVRDHRPTAFEREMMRHAAIGEFGFGLGIDDPEIEAHSPPSPGGRTHAR